MSTMRYPPTKRLSGQRMRVLVWTAAILALLLGLTTAVALAYSPSAHVQFELQACRFFSGLTLPNSDGKYICPDAAYVNGNLGSGWNELDLVPHRLITTLGTQGGATTDYDVVLAADYQTAGKTGYDAISVPVLNAAKSHASCTGTAGAQSTAGGVTGGADSVIYRVLTVHQDKGSTCVFDYYQRLALGASLYSGSSLQSYMFEREDFSTGKRTLSIPVKEILPQSISKDMTASQAAAYAWSVTKLPNPATLSFDDTCNAEQPKEKGVQISISWEKLAATPGQITVITHIYATNPSARVVTVNVTDQIYAGTTPVGSPASSGPIDVPANTANVLLLTHNTTVAPGPTSLNDVATATYTDKATGLAVPGTTTAAASAPVQVTYTNNSATINDVESITGTGLSFSADSFSPPGIGSFNGGYVAGTKTTGQVSWTSISQSGSSSVTFNKKVYIAGPSQLSNEKLHDVATLTGSDGFNASSTADVSISADARVRLTIHKNIDLAQASDQVFTFKVNDSGGNNVDAAVTVLAGQTTGSTTVPNLAPGNITVSEDPKTGWVTGSNQSANISLPSCSGEVTFENIAPKDLTVTHWTDPSYTRTYNWDIDKNVDKTKVSIPSGGTATFNYTVDVDQTGFTDSEWKGFGKITVSNPNSYDVTGVNVTDEVDNGGTCTVTGGTNVTVPKNGSAVLDYTCDYASPPSSYSGKNKATATWPSFGSPNTSASHTVDFTFALTKTVNKTVHVTDSYGGALGQVTATDTQPYASASFQYQRTENGVGGECTDYDNTATIVETGQTASQEVTVCVGLDLEVSKTADPIFTRTYLWNITKSVDKNLVTLPGGTAAFNYTVGVSQTGFTDSGWGLQGIITIVNPNKWEAITLSGITDLVNNGGTCLVDTDPANVILRATYKHTVLLPFLIGGKRPVSQPVTSVVISSISAPVTIPESSTVLLHYACTYTSPPTSTNGHNTATAAWDKAAYFTPNGQASGGADFAFDTPENTVNKTVHVTDSYAGYLGEVTATDSLPYASASFPYPRNIPVAFGCQDYPNTATITETGQTASQLVTVCGPMNTGARTIGFWQNKNGQGLIVKTGSTLGVCNLTPWLREYNPFRDLPSSSSCSSTALYVYNVIKAASAAGTSMNPMLKAQMLATALDVYYSDPALGGNKLGAPAPIGGALIDLTHVCDTISFTCAFEDASSAFGGAASMRVSDLLAYAGSQSTAGGGLWYGNVKSTQELAKDAFDAINNQVAVSP